MEILKHQCVCQYVKYIMKIDILLIKKILIKWESNY